MSAITLFTSTIVDDGSTQMRHAMSEQTVREYKESMEALEVFPPIEVLYDEESGNYIVIDGHHRLAAARAAEFPRIDAIVVGKGNGQDAQWLALRANAANSLRRTIPDREKSIAVCLAHPKSENMTEEQIAEATGTSRREVFRVRQKIGAVKNPGRTRDIEYESALAIIKEDSPKLADELSVGIITMPKEEVVRLAAKPDQERKALVPVMAEERLTLRQAEKIAKYYPRDENLPMKVFLDFTERNPEERTYFFRDTSIQVDVTVNDA